ncbi:hypothetical protein [Komagataeibacter xylinus]|uniref:hypothetical protein n=1 Tax=Komagataeibacter xylinus TaxID=28448 RepID=UPI00280A6D97|nr:hypothetical protein [Komagataeibacter xylinus]
MSLTLMSFIRSYCLGPGHYTQSGMHHGPQQMHERECRFGTLQYFVSDEALAAWREKTPCKPQRKESETVASGSP